MIRMMINDGDGNDGDHNDEDYDHTNNVDYDHYHKEGASVGTQSHLASREARACGIVAMIVIVKSIPHICHGRHRRRPCKFFLADVNFYRFNAKNWQFTV